MTQTNTPRGSETKAGGERDIAEIEAQIDQTRNAISGDLRTLGERLTPEHLKEEAKEVMLEAKNAATDKLHEAKDNATQKLVDAKDNAMDTVTAKVDEMRDNVRYAEREAAGFLRDNAVPLALIGAGMAWFISNRRNGEREWDGDYRPRGRGRWRYPERPGGDLADAARERSSDLGEGSRDLAAKAKERAQHWAEGAQHKLGDVAERARGFAEGESEHLRAAAEERRQHLGRAAERARHARESSRQVADEHPLAIGAAALAAGIFVGLLIPSTHREREALGSRRDRLVGDAKGAAHEWSHTAKEAARDIKSSLSGSAS